jgi:hypothetical protein
MLSDATLGLVVQLGLTVAASLFCHWWSKAYLPASIISAVTANVLFQVFDYLHEGHFNKFALVGFTFGTLYSFIVALLIGLPFLIYRKRRTKLSSSPVEND